MRGRMSSWEHEDAYFFLTLQGCSVSICHPGLDPLTMSVCVFSEGRGLDQAQARQLQFQVEICNRHYVRGIL